MDKQRLDAASYTDKEGKESVNFAFPFHVPGGEMRLDLPLGVIRPELDQMPSACKNWLTVGRWADVANRDFGVTWVTLDAPLVQVGGITATLLNSQTNPDTWRKTIEPTQQLYSWAMNNHWGTNYRAYQEGPTVFRFVLRPHRRLDPAEASRFAIGLQPAAGRDPRPGTETPRRPAVPAVEPRRAGHGAQAQRRWQVVDRPALRRSGKDRAVELTWPGPEAAEDLAQRHERAAYHGGPWPGHRARPGASSRCESNRHDERSLGCPRGTNVDISCDAMITRTEGHLRSRVSP